MSRAIDTITVSSIEDRRLVLGNAHCARVLQVGTDWTTLRMGFRFTFADSGGNLTAPNLKFGLLASPAGDLANGALTSSTSHFLGLSYVSNATRNTSPTRYTAGANWSMVRRIGSTNNSGTGSPGAVGNYSATPEQRCCLIIQATKGSPNFTSNGITPISTAVPDVSLTLLQSAMEQTTMANAETTLNAALGGTHYDLAGNVTHAIDEAANGYFNSIYLGWAFTVPKIQVSDIVFAKIA